MSTELRNVIREEFKKSLMGRVFDIFLRDFTKNHEGVPYNFNILDLKKITELYVNIFWFRTMQEIMSDNLFLQLICTISEDQKNPQSLNLMKMKKINSLKILGFLLLWMSSTRKWLQNMKLLCAERYDLNNILERRLNEKSSCLAYCYYHLLCLWWSLVPWRNSPIH